MRYVIFSLILLSGTAFSFSSNSIMFSEGSYRSLPLSKEIRSKLETSSRISMDVFNPSKNNKIFYLVFEDENSVDYWTKLNFKTTLVSGKNKLVFDLTRKLGERGSHQVERTLNFKKIKKAFVFIEPDGHVGKKQFEISDIAIFNPPELKPPEGMRMFSFGDYYKGELPDFFTIINDKTMYGKNKPNGFLEVDVWRSEDDQIEPKWVSKSIGVNKAVFRMTLPPGEYQYHLVWDRVGYWDVPFWGKRKFFIDGFPETIETRTNVSDFMRDYLSLTKEPTAKDHPYEFYLKRILSPLQGEFKVKSSFVDFKFTGDPSGASLNMIMVWPKGISSDAKKFLKVLDVEAKERFEQKYRRVLRPDTSKDGFSVGVVHTGKNLRPNTSCKPKSSNRLVTAKNGKVALDICVVGDQDKEVVFDFGTLKSGENKIKPDDWELAKYKYRFKALDLNHETYELRVEDLEYGKDNRFLPNGHRKSFFHIRLKRDSVPEGEYSGKLKITQGEHSRALSIKLHVLNKKYKDSVINAGVIGLSPFPKTYFTAYQLKDVDYSYHLKALEKLNEIGLKVFTDIPTPSISYDKEFKKFTLASKDVEKFIARISSRDVFLYDGKFPKNLLNGHFRNASQDLDSFSINLKQQFKKFLKRMDGKSLVYLYSDEATGYRNAVEEDTKLGRRIKSLLPGIKIGGFGNLYEWEKGKGLYQTWDFGLYSDIPSVKEFQKLDKHRQEFGLYNLCAGPDEDLSFCFGTMLYRLQKNGIKHYFEWHASAIHNYPGYDLDGRESDIAFFYPSNSGKIVMTRRYVQALMGMEKFNKLNLLENSLASSTLGSKEKNKISKFLGKINDGPLFPIARFKSSKGNLKRFVDENLDDLMLELY